MIELTNTDYLEILNYNKGFVHPEKWIAYAKKYDFKKVDAVKISNCPDCKSNKYKKIGQYIYFSNLIQLLSCRDCGLIFSDVRLNDEVVNYHFEKTYKDKHYFEMGRREIFFQITTIIDTYLPQAGRIIDIGGATGHLAYMINKLRPDADITVNDLSITACNYITETYGFKNLCSPLSELEKHIDTCYDVVLLIDILYYEPDIDKAFNSIKKIINDDGCIIMRIPNKIWLIRSLAFLKKLLYSKEKLELSSKVNYFNPESLYLFSQRYLMNRLKSMGFSKITFFPSRTLSPENCMAKIFMFIIFALSKFLYYISLKKIIITPSQLLLVTK